jgi:hypothetical protein
MGEVDKMDEGWEQNGNEEMRVGVVDSRWGDFESSTNKVGHRGRQPPRPRQADRQAAWGGDGLGSENARRGRGR